MRFQKSRTIFLITRIGKPGGWAMKIGGLLNLIFWVSFLTFSQGALGSLYDDLGIDPSATQDQINRAWLKLRNSYHPDAVISNGKNLTQEQANKIFVFLKEEQTVEEIQQETDPELESYKSLKAGFYILKDPNLRKNYDDWLNSPAYEEDMRRREVPAQVRTPAELKAGPLPVPIAVVRPQTDPCFMRRFFHRRMFGLSIEATGRKTPCERFGLFWKRNKTSTPSIITEEPLYIWSPTELIL